MAGEADLADSSRFRRVLCGPGGLDSSRLARLAYQERNEPASSAIRPILSVRHAASQIRVSASRFASLASLTLDALENRKTMDKGFACTQRTIFAGWLIEDIGCIACIHRLSAAL